MEPYQIFGTGPKRVLVLLANASQRFKFWQIIDEERVAVHFKQAGSRLVAVVSDCVMVYKKPNPNIFHYEYMKHSARANWLGVVPEHDRLVEDLLEYIERI